MIKICFFYFSLWSSNLNQLEYLDLSNNRIKYILPNGFPESLKFINLTNNVLTRVPSYMPLKLERIALSNNSLTSIHAIWNKMENLELLNLANNQISRIQVSHCFSQIKNYYSYLFNKRPFLISVFKIVKLLQFLIGKSWHPQV